jgi:predicted DNA-binding protein
MASSKPNSKSQILSVVLPNEERDRLTALAETEVRSKSKMATILIKEALDARGVSHKDEPIAASA